MTDIALYLPSLDGGGAEMVMLRLASALAERGADIDLVLARARGPYLELVPSAVRIVDLGARPPVVVTKTALFARYLRRVRPGVILSALDVVDTALLARAAAGLRTPILLTIHTHLSRQFADKPDGGGAAIRRALIRTLYPRTDALAAVSRGVADDAARIVRLPADWIRVLPNPLPVDELQARAREPVEHPFLVPGAPPVVLAVGRFVRQKDFLTLVEAFARVRARRPARLIILGDADPREPAVLPAVRELIQARGLSDDVDLPGFVANPQAFMARAAVLALSSIYEGLPTVLTESLAVGTTTVATDCDSGPAEILDGGRYGALVEIRNPAALADGIVEALERPRDPVALRRRADGYRTERVADEYLRVLTEIAGPLGT